MRLAREQQLAGAAAIALGMTLVLPWYEKSYVPRGGTEFVSNGLSALGAFSWVEAAVLLVSASVLVLLHGRHEGRAFHLPFGDGPVIMGAGVWAGLLIVWRLFDRPDVEQEGVGAATVGIQWGIFLALAAAAALALAGARLRAARVPEPPLPGEDFGWVEPRTRRARARGENATTETRPLRRARTDVLGEPPPRWEGDSVEPPTLPMHDAAPRGGRAQPPARRDETPTTPPEQDRLF